MFALEAGSPILRDDGRYGAFEQPAFRKVIRFLSQLLPPRDSHHPSRARRCPIFFRNSSAGTSAMSSRARGTLRGVKNRLDSGHAKEWMTAAMPASTGRESVALGSSLSLFGASQHKKEAWLLIGVHVSSGNPATVLRAHGRSAAEEGGRGRIRRSRTIVHQGIPRSARAMVPLPQVPEWEEIATTIYEHGEQAIRKAKTVIDSGDRVDQSVNAMLR